MSFRKAKNIILFTLLLAFPTVVWAKSVIIKGNFENAGNATYIYLYQFIGPELVKKDSIHHKSGSFEFKLKDNVGRGLYKIGTSEERAVSLIIGKESFSFSADLNDLPQSVKTTGSKENEAFYQYRNFNDFYNQQVQLLQNHARKVNAEKDSDPEKYEYEMSRLQIKLDSLNSAQKKEYNRLVSENKNLLIGKIVSLFIYNPDETAENFFTKEFFNDPELARGDMILSRVSNYLQRFSQPNLDAWKASFSKLLSQAPNGSPGREALYLSLIRLVYNYDLSYARQLAESYASEYSSSTVATRLLAAIPAGPPVKGDKAPDIELNDPQGNKKRLSDLKGKVVLLDFWASWCGPCRMENPNVVKAYNKYKDKGFTVFSVSLDTDKQKWIDAIKKDDLAWTTHVSDLQGWKSEPAKLYQVRGIPATYLIGKDGKIIAVNLRGESLESMLEQLFN